MFRLALLAACAALLHAERADVDLDLTDSGPERSAGSAAESGTRGREVKRHAPAASSLAESELEAEAEEARSHAEKGAPSGCGPSPTPSPDDETEGLQPNPPTSWGPNVHIFKPDSDFGIIEEACKSNGVCSERKGERRNHGHWSEKRYAFMFAPGEYHQRDVPVGYYTSVYGLGVKPSDTVFTGPGGVFCEQASDEHGHGALDTFWRSAENFRNKPGMLWAASQASPLRRVEVDGDLRLSEEGWSSGGFLADSKVHGKVDPGTQQQYFGRNNEVREMGDTVWNLLNVGVKGAGGDKCLNTGKSDKSRVSVATTPVVAEKPYIVMQPGDKFELRVPQPRRNSAGPSWLDPAAPEDRVIDFSRVYVAVADRDTAASVNKNLRNKDVDAVVFTPGWYNFTEPIKVKKKGVVLLGLGFATLVASNGNVAIEVDGDHGEDVHVAAILLQAGQKTSKALLHWTKGSGASEEKPGFLHDTFARVGGPDRHKTSLDTMVLVESDYVVGDHFWLWRADHDVNIDDGAGGHPRPDFNYCKHGFIVRGDHVTTYGLMVEHTLEDMTIWEGEDGRCYFLQSEIPYGVTQEMWGDKGYVSYLVRDHVRTHHAVSLGAYIFFRDHEVVANSGIKAPEHLVSSFVNPMSVHLDKNGKLNHVINNHGEHVGHGRTATVYCNH